MADTIDSVIDDAVAQHPEPSQQAPQIVEEVMRLHAGDDASAAPGAPQRGALDRKGNAYDPSKHTSVAPFLTARGTWRKRRAGDAQDERAGMEIGGDGDGGAALAEIDTSAAAEHWIDGATGILSQIFGEDWKPEKSERTHLIGCTERYMKASGVMADLPPGWLLLAAIGVYASTRLPVGAIVEKAKGMLGKSESAAETQTQVA